MVIRKSGISITLTPKQNEIITADAERNGRSISAEIGYLIENRKADAEVHKIIFQELASIKKQLQERFE